MREIRFKYKLEHFCFAQFKPINSIQTFDHDTKPHASDAWIQVFSETADKEVKMQIHFWYEIKLHHSFQSFINIPSGLSLGNSKYEIVPS